MIGIEEILHLVVMISWHSEAMEQESNDLVKRFLATRWLFVAAVAVTVVAVLLISDRVSVCTASIPAICSEYPRIGPIGGLIVGLGAIAFLVFTTVRFLLVLREYAKNHSTRAHRLSIGSKRDGANDSRGRDR
ncbi:hypothetical protein [Humidisolicoccus flavus]|uniref:hypothetical protein n=1 Tax=Humidisolicoccus flavus TaxID=3111414 RepID=UPI00325209D2